MNVTIIEQPALRLITAKAETFPEGNAAAFQAIESKLATLKGRKMYGLVFGMPDGLEYHAGLVPESAEEERAFGFPILEIAAGSWARTKLFDWEGRTQEIGPTIGKMIAEHGIDPTRPTMEYYRSRTELHLLVPVPGRRNA